MVETNTISILMMSDFVLHTRQPKSSSWEVRTVLHRPGEQREPLPVEFESIPGFAESAAAIGIGIELAVAISFERRLLLDDAIAAGWNACRAESLLDAVAGRPRLEGELGGAMSAYLRLISACRAKAAVCSESSRLVPFPLRLYARAESLEPARALTPDAVEQALQWEIAATATRRTMIEWGLVTLLHGS